MDKQEKYLELWGDLVGLKDMVLAIFISGFCTMSGFFLAPSGNTTRQLFYGLAGAVLALVLNTVFIKPKRLIKKQNHQ